MVCHTVDYHEVVILQNDSPCLNPIYDKTLCSKEATLCLYLEKDVVFMNVLNSLVAYKQR